MHRQHAIRRCLPIFLLGTCLIRLVDQPALAQAPASAPVVRLLLPLYHDPADGDTWARVAAAGSHIPITAIINPDNGPGSGPPSQAYTQGNASLRASGVIVLGYVYSSYAARPIAAVKSDVDTYARYYQLDGIFVDESATSAADQPYYTER